MWHNRKFARKLALAETMSVLTSEIHGGGKGEREIPSTAMRNRNPSVVANIDVPVSVLLTGCRIYRARQLPMKAQRRAINPLIDRPHPSTWEVPRPPNTKRAQFATAVYARARLLT